MKRILLVILAAILAACTPGEPGVNAPLQLTHNAATKIQALRATTPGGREAVAECYDQNLQSDFASRVADAHFGAVVVGFFPNGNCYWAEFRNLNSAQSAKNTVLGICQNRGISDCTLAAVAVPDMIIPFGARTVSYGVSEWLANDYLTAPGYSALAMTETGYEGLGLNAPDQATADQWALQDCADDMASGSGWNVNDPERATQIFREEPGQCQIVNRRSPDGTMTPRVLPY